MGRYPTWKRIALEKAQDEIIEIMDLGHRVTQLTDYHWKINGMDVWPSSKTFMRGGVVREYDRLIEVIK